MNKNIVNLQKITLEETRIDLIKLWGMLRKLEEQIVYPEQWENALERIMAIFDNARGFVVKSHLRELTNCFWVEANWSRYEIQQQHLGKQMLVCIIEREEDILQIYEYLYQQGKRANISEVIFCKKNYSMFTGEEHKRIRKVFKGKYVKCVFIQEENFKCISLENGWRQVFYEVLSISRIS